MEFTEIIKEDEIRTTNPKMLANKHFVNAVILFWSVSLFQFPLTIYAMERTAQRLEKEKAQLEEELKRVKEEKETRRKRNQVAPSPALFAYKKSRAQDGSERGEIQIKYIQTKYGLEIKPQTSVSTTDEEMAMADKLQRRRCRRCFCDLDRAFSVLFRKVEDYTELVNLLIPMIMQDGPFLIVRLLVIAYYNVYHDTLYFLTVKNALVVMLQVYRIFVLYYKPPDEDTDELFPENDASSRLHNVQTAIKSVRHTRLAIRLVSRLQKQAKWRRSLSYDHFKRPKTPMRKVQGKDELPSV